MSDKTERQQIFGTDDEEDEYPMSQDDSSKLGGSAPRRGSRVRITNQQKMQAVAHFQTNKGSQDAFQIGIRLGTLTFCTKATSHPGWTELSSISICRCSIARRSRGVKRNG